MEVRATGRRVWPLCAATVVVLSALVLLVQPALLAVAAPGLAVPENPVRVRLSPATDALGGGTLRPGEPSYRPVTVHNDGSSPFRYHVSIAAGGALARQILVELRAVPGACDAQAFAAAATVVAGPAPMDQLAAPDARPLEPGGAERLCARVELPEGASAPSGEPVADAVLRVTATQD